MQARQRLSWLLLCSVQLAPYPLTSTPEHFWREPDLRRLLQEAGKGGWKGLEDKFLPLTELPGEALEEGTQTPKTHAVCEE